MAKKITVYNLKGGVGKTFIVYALAMYIQYINPDAKILVVDIDQQANTTSLLSEGSEETFLEPDRNITLLFSDTLYDGNPYKIIYKTGYDGIYLLPSSMALSVREIQAYTVIKPSERLKMFLDKVDQNFDYIIMDNPPALNIYTTNTFMSAEYALIPIIPDKLSLHGVSFQINILKKVMLFNQGLKVVGLLPNLVDTRYKDHKHYLHMLTAIYKEAIIEPYLGRRAMYQRMLDRYLTFTQFKRFNAYKEDVDNLANTMQAVLDRIESGFDAMPLFLSGREAVV